MLIHPTAAPASTSVDAGARVVVPALAPHRIKAPGDEAPPQQRQESAAGEPAAAEREALQAAVDRLNEHYRLQGAELHFQVDRERKRLVVTVLDARDGTLIRQLSSEQALGLAQALQNGCEMPALLQQTA